MVKGIVLDIINSIEKNIINRDLDLKKENFAEIKKESSNKKIAFIDGGQAELLKAANFSLQFIRTAALIFKNNKREDLILNEFFVLILAESNEGMIEYKTEVFPLKGSAIDNIKMDSLDPTIKEGNERASASKIGNIIRRFAELEFAKQTIKKLGKEDVIVLDGSLKCMVKGEDNYMKALADESIESGIVLASLAKTSKILSSAGASIAGQLNLLGEKSVWSYSLDDEEGYAASIVKLNKNSEHVFEFNILKPQKEHMQEILSILSANSNDPIFQGYPYGLIQADKFARVTNQEKDYLFTLLKANAGKKWAKLKAYTNVLNAHSILDNVR